MGEMSINDIVGYYLPDRLVRLMNTAEIVTGRTNYEIIVAALEKYLREQGIAEQAEDRDQNRIFINTGFKPWETGGLNCQYQKVRI